MLKAKFYLKDSKNPTSVYFRGLYRGQKFKVYLGIKINPDHWNQSEMIVRDIMEEKHRHIYNRMIRDFIRRVNEANEKLHKFNSKDHLVDFLKGSEKYDYSFLDYLEKIHCDKIPNDKSIHKNIKTYYLKGNSVDWDSVQKKQFADKFHRHLEKRGFSLNYIGRHFKVIKSVVKSAYDDEILKTYNTQFLKVEQEQSDTIYLNEDELELINKLELKGYLDDARDRFLIGCYTGLRFNDFVRFNPEKDISDGMIKLRTGNKAGNKSTDVTIPIHPIVQEILEKRNYNLPRSISNQKMNDYLKTLGKKAKIEQNITTYTTKGGRITSQTNKKYDLITTHTARRSFATNAFKAGIPSILIMKITGHKTEKSFLRYIKLTAEESAIQMAQSTFFQRKKESP